MVGIRHTDQPTAVKLPASGAEGREGDQPRQLSNNALDTSFFTQSRTTLRSSGNSLERQIYHTLCPKRALNGYRVTRVPASLLCEMGRVFRWRVSVTVRHREKMPQ